MEKVVAGAVVAAVAVLAACAALCVYVLYSKYRKYMWRSVGCVSNILIYPIKSGPALEVNQATCTESGLRHHKLCDRYGSFNRI